MGKESLTALPSHPAISSHASCRLNPTRGTSGVQSSGVSLPGHRAGLSRAATESEAGDQIGNEQPRETKTQRSKPSSRDRQTDKEKPSEVQSV